MLGVASEIDQVRFEGREVHLGVFPMGVDAASFEATAREPAVAAEARVLRGEPNTQLLLSVDRLDYTKGIPRRLLAYERLLSKHPDLREKVRFVQVAVPSRQDVGAYQDFRREAEELIGRIQGAFATPHWVPVHWMHRSLSREELVAKEFVASRVDEDGVLVLSEFAGGCFRTRRRRLGEPLRRGRRGGCPSAGALDAARGASRADEHAAPSRARAIPDTSWHEPVLHVLDEFAARTPRWSPSVGSPGPGLTWIH